MTFFSNKSHKKSFSLPEISVVIAVLAFLTFTSVRSLQNVLNKTQTSVDKQKIKIVKQALQTYFNTHGYLPAPADYTLTNNDAKYGKSKTAKNDYDGSLNGDFFYNADIYDLPQEYQEVEYIESSGTQYIDTDVYPDKTTEIEMAFSMRNLIPSYVFPSFFGARSANHSDDSMVFCGEVNDRRFRVEYAGTIFQVSVNIGQKNYIKTSNNYLYFNGQTYNYEFPEMKDGKATLFLFTLNHNNQTEDSYGGLQGNKIIYYTKIKKNDQLVRDFIPCYRKSDGEIGLYDKVEGKFYTNVGTGTFLKGKNISSQQTKRVNSNYTIYRGIVPFRELGFAEEDVVDSKGNFFEYYVPEIMTIETGNGNTNLFNNIIQSEYQEVEYIESTGTQWIDLNVKADSTTIITTDIQYNDISNQYNGCLYSGQNRFDFGIFRNKWYFYYGTTSSCSYDGDNMINSSFNADTNRHNIIYSIPNRTIQIDQTIVQQKATCTLQTLGDNLHLFARSLNGVNDGNLQAKLYSFKMTKNNSLVRDMVPCYRKSDGEIGLYDKVQGKFYTNQGSGKFLKGEDVNNNTSTGYTIKKLDSDYPYSNYPCPAKKGDIPSSICTETTSNLFGVEMVKTEIKEDTKYEKMYQPVEYIESTGTQWIDTNVKANLSTIVYTDIQYSNIDFNFNGYDGHMWTRFQFGIFGEKWYFFYGATNNKDKLQSRFNADTNRHMIIYNIIDQTMKIDNNLVDLNNTNVPYANEEIATIDSYSLAIFGRKFNSDTQIDYYTKAKLYRMKIEQNNQLVRDFIPCYRKSDKKPGLYDKVEGKFYTNQGSGEFLIGKKSAFIPEEYKRIEYIESTGTQWIDTGIIPNNNMNFTMDMQFFDLQNQNDDRQSGCGLSSNQERVLLISKNGYFGCAIGTQYNNVFNISADNNRHTFSIDLKNSQCKMDNNVKTLVNTYTGTQYSFYFFARHASSITNSSRNTRLYNAKIYENENIIRNFIPCYRKSDKKPGLYDKVEGKFYTNQGSGKFLKGEDYIPEEYEEIEYIESTGTQWIDTGIKPNSNTSVEIDMAIMNENPNNNWSKVFGVKNGPYEFFLQSNKYAANAPLSNKFSFTCGYNRNPYVAAASSDYVFGRKHHIKTSNCSIQFDNSITNASSMEDFTTDKNMTIFAVNNNGTITQHAYMRLYSFKITQNNSLVRDMVPCYRKSDGELGLYDRVSKTFFTNQGSGDFSTNYNYISVEEPITTTTITTSKINQPPYGLRIKNLKTEKDIEPNGSVAYLLLSHGEDGEKTCSIKRPTKIGQTPISINTLENASKINATNKFEAQNCFNAVKQDTYNLVARSDFLTGTNTEYMFYKGNQNADFDDIVEYSTLAELLKNVGINY